MVYYLISFGLSELIFLDSLIKALEIVFCSLIYLLLLKDEFWKEGVRPRYSPSLGKGFLAFFCVSSFYVWSFQCYLYQRTL